jgi:hypothetical protein
MTNAEIIEAATLGLAVYSLSDDEFETAAGKDITARWDAAIKPMQESGDSGDLALVMMAVKLLGGSRYGVNTDNPESARRARSIAADLGALVLRGRHKPQGSVAVALFDDLDSGGA